MQEYLIIVERRTQSGAEVQLAKEHVRRACIVCRACSTWRAVKA